jgi:Leucine-rich repeat (LRR) protein
MIENLEIEVFCGLVYLKHIYLEGNKLQYFHPDTFRGLPKVQRLFLSKNSGRQIPNDYHFINSLSLKHHGISGCNISSVSAETFANIRKLELLDLRYNYQKSLDINILQVIPNLSHLYLQSNEINEIISGE